MQLSARLLRAAALAPWLALAPASATAQVAELELRSTAFLEPSPTSKMTVLTPAATLGVLPAEWLRLDVGWEADIVSGASEAVKAGPLVGPDVVSAASVHDTRHVVSGGFTILRDVATLSAAYSRGTESDYRSNAITVSAGSDFLQRNTQIRLSYAHGFDEVCDANNPGSRDPTLRVALDTSEGCFTDDTQRATRDIALDTFQSTWSQSWTPVFVTQLSLTGALQNGFLGNPYRAVVVGPTGQVAQEYHPENRGRGAAGLRLRWFVRPLGTALGLSVRGYRDTWEVTSQTVEVDAERNLSGWLRAQVRGRWYRQSGALFYSDDYTGGEPVYGPRGRYFTGDRELSPLSSWMVGGRVVATVRPDRDQRLVGVLLSAKTSLSFDLLSTRLERFTWGGIVPDDTVAYIAGLSIGGSF